MYEKNFIDMLSQDGVSIRTQKYTVADGVEYAIGIPHRCAYVNSERGRAAVINDLPEQYATAIMAVWGDAPTVIEEEMLGV